MIAHVFGTVAEKFANAIIVDVSGIGYEVCVPVHDFDQATIGSEIKLYTHHHIREQSQELFGFSSLAAKKLFQLLITVQGVGPKAALAILSLDSTENVRNAIANADSVYIAKASGVGKKTAEGVVVKLSDKVGLPVIYKPDNNVPHGFNVDDEALEALIALGYNLQDATVALADVDSTLTTSERVRLALKSS